MTKTVDYIEAKSARYFKAVDYSSHDVVVVKELIHYTDGTSERKLKPWVDVERPFYITKEGFRNHNDQKECEDISKLTKYTTKQCDLHASIRRAMGQVPNRRDQYSVLARNQYLYGSTVSTPTLLMNHYQKKQGSKPITPHSLAVLDLETDTLRGTDEIITGAIVTSTGVRCFFTDAYQGTETDLLKRIHKYDWKLLGERIDISKIDIVVEQVPFPEDVTIALLKVAHEWKPDFLAIWNMNFDIPVMIKSLVDAGKNPADYFCDPSVPAIFRHFKYREAPRQRVTASKTINKHSTELWHVLDCPSSFYVVDAMVLYKLLRVAAGMEPSYALDDILRKEGLGGKLRFDKAEGLTKLDWHREMSSKYKLEYIEYNIFDCLSMIQLDAKTEDISVVLPLLCGYSEFSKFPSTPRRLADDYEFLCMEYGKIAGTASDEMMNDHDRMVMQMAGFIVTLPGFHLNRDMGIQVYGKDGSKIHTGILLHSYDIDVRGAYPYGQIATNISKTTTVGELCSIHGIELDMLRKVMLNFTSADVNAVELVCTLTGAPNMYQMGQLYEASLK